MIRSHVLGNPSCCCKSLQMTLGPWGSTQVVKPADDLQHRGKSKAANSITQALMGSKAKVHVCVHVAVKSDFLRLGENRRIHGGSNLEWNQSVGFLQTSTKESVSTYKVAYDLLSRFQVQLLTLVFYDRGLCHLTR